MSDLIDKKITFFISSLGGGGAEGVCVNIANSLSERGWQVTLLVLHLNNSVYHKRLNDKVELVVLGINHARHALVPLYKYLVKQRPEKILVFYYELTAILIMLRSIMKYKFTIITRNVNTLSYNRKDTEISVRKYLYRCLVDNLYKKSDHFINQCNGMRDDLISLYDINKDKISVIYNPINNIVEKYAMNLDFNSIKKENYLLCVGRLENQKSFHYAIEAFSNIKAEYPDLRLKIVGQGGLEAELKSLASKLDVSNKVDFEGFQDDIIPYYLKARMVLLSSLYEGFPNVLIESIALGTPVVAFDCPSGPKEIIIDDVNGYLVKYLCVGHFSDCIRKALNKKWVPEIISLTSNKYKINDVIVNYENVFGQI